MVAGRWRLLDLSGLRVHCAHQTSMVAACHRLVDLLVCVASLLVATRLDAIESAPSRKAQAESNGQFARDGRPQR